MKSMKANKLAIILKAGLAAVILLLVLNGFKYKSTKFKSNG